LVSVLSQVRLSAGFSTPQYRIGSSSSLHAAIKKNRTNNARSDFFILKEIFKLLRKKTEIAAFIDQLATS
jgi:hypothetical protein